MLQTFAHSAPNQDLSDHVRFCSAVDTMHKINIVSTLESLSSSATLLQKRTTNWDKDALGTVLWCANLLPLGWWCACVPPKPTAKNCGVTFLHLTFASLGRATLCGMQSLLPLVCGLFAA